MKQIFVNLKRFDVPKKLGGICLMDNPKEWIEWVIAESIACGLGKLDDILVTYLLPESLLIPAIEKLNEYSLSERKTIAIGCQGVFRENIVEGGNFGAFTTNLPAAAAKNINCTWAIIGHSEERKDKLGIIAQYDSDTTSDMEKMRKAKNTVDNLINSEILCALSSGINALLCVGETAEEKGSGDFEEQKTRIEDVLRSQLDIGLKNIEIKNPEEKIVIGYEPIWAIGPGKTPPGEDYISFVSSFIKKHCSEALGFDPIVVYGGGLKEENALMIANINTIGGGLVALTKFTQPIAFEPDGLKKIIAKYVESK